MDYEKKYNEALSKCKAYIDDTEKRWSEEFSRATEEVFKEIFPELAESEDERMLNTIIRGFESWKGNGNVRFNNTDVDDILSYLEKQKESLHISETCKENEDSFTDEDERIRKTLVEYFGPKVQLDFVRGVPIQKIRDWLEKQKEQKPELVQQPPITYTYNSNASRDERLKAALLALLNSDLIKVKDGGYFTKHDLIEWVERIELKPAEWSEEDERHLIWLCRIIHSRVVNKELSLAEESELGKWMDKWLNHEPQPVQKWDEFDEDCLKRAIWYVENPAPSVVKDTNLVLWLKSLPERFNLQPKQEWSEEDEEMLEYVIGDVNDAKQLFATKEAIDLCDKEIAWLKSLRPSWKPSEEQSMKED